MALLGWTGDNGDPDNFFFLRGCTGAREGGQNIPKWCNKDFETGSCRRGSSPRKPIARSFTKRCRSSRRKRRRMSPSPTRPCSSR